MISFHICILKLNLIKVVKGRLSNIYLYENEVKFSEY